MIVVMLLPVFVTGITYRAWDRNGNLYVTGQTTMYCILRMFFVD